MEAKSCAAATRLAIHKRCFRVDFSTRQPVAATARLGSVGTAQTPTDIIRGLVSEQRVKRGQVGCPGNEAKG
jgi:hypothetical protein